MRTGASTFVTFTVFGLPALLLGGWVSGNGIGTGIALFGLFALLMFCNRLDKRSIKDKIDR